MPFDLQKYYTPENIDLALSPLVLVALFFLSFIFNVGRYLSWSAFLFWYYYKRNPALTGARKLQKQWPSAKQIKNEIRWSISSCLVYAVMTMALYFAAMRGWTRLYLDLEADGLIYVFWSVIMMLFLHDAYFYLTHLLSHRVTYIFRKFHRIHHQSANPTPFADIMFHPVDAVIHAGFVPLFLFLIPLHPLAVGLFLGLVTVVNCIGHTGFEPFPKWMEKVPLVRLISRASLHNIHHSHVHYNFGLYFRFYDLMFKTELQPDARDKNSLERSPARSA